MLGAFGAVLLMAAPIKVAVPAFTVIGIDQPLAEAWSEHFVTLLGSGGRLSLTTQRDIAQVLGLERRKQLLGCGESQSSCLAELAGALGVDAILSGTLAKGGSSFTATLRIVRSNDGSVIATATARLKNDEALQDWLDAQAPLLAAKAEAAFREREPRAPSGETEVRAPAETRPLVRWLPAIAGGVFAVGGAALFAASKDKANELKTATFSSPEKVQEAASAGRTLESTGVASLITGGVAIAASVVWVLSAPAGGAQVAAAPLPGGGAVAVGGAFW